MVRAVYSTDDCLKYLKENAARDLFMVGLILGQSTESRETIVHLVRTPEEKIDETSDSEGVKQPQESLPAPSSVNDVSEAWVADHAKHVTRMLPGGIFVQGIFIICEEDVFNNQLALSKVRSILNYNQKCLGLIEKMYGIPPSEERLVIHMAPTKKELVCKSVTLGKAPSKIGHVDFKYLPKNSHWQRLDCVYEFDDLHPVVAKNGTVSVKQQFSKILDRAAKQIESSVVLIDGEFRQNSDVLESLGNRVKSKGKPNYQEPPKPMNVSLFIPFTKSHSDTVEYLDCEGSTHLSGVVTSRVFLPPKASVAEAVLAVKQDLVRSLASRFTMHCDALIDDNLLPEERVCFNEPPRRVFVPLQSGGSTDGLMLCDYLFPGETPAEALVSVKELLDLELRVGDVISDLETPADMAEYDALDKESVGETAPAPRSRGQLACAGGAALAALVLLVAVLVHYLY